MPSLLTSRIGARGSSRYCTWCSEAAQYASLEPYLSQYGARHLSELTNPDESRVMEEIGL
jgi:hypothetical protein